MQSSASRDFVAPGRVNLLGEHTDYTGGLVLPMAIPFTTTARIAPAEGVYRFSSEEFPEVLELTPDDRSERRRQWSDYPVGVLRQLQNRGIEVPGFSLHLHGNVPFGAGLSSSASVLVASAMAMLAHSRVTLAPEEVAVLCRRAENDFVGTPVGIMDQFTITCAAAHHALLLDTGSLKYENIPMDRGSMAGTAIVVCNSMVRHSIASGTYAVRHREVMTGQDILRETYGVEDLGDASLDQLEAVANEMPHESYLRCRHIISDSGRVRQAREAMLAGDANRMGKLMLAGHVSERDDFACSVEEIDFLVDTAAKLPGCFGARLTGGGFGGCTVNLVAKDKAEAFVTALLAAYKERFNIDGKAWICEASDGAAIRNANHSEEAQ